MIEMKFSLRRRVEGLTPDEIDAEIEVQQHRAEELVKELSDTIELQAALWRQMKEDESDGPRPEAS